MSTITLPEGFGSVVLTGVGSIFMALYFSIQVGQARKKYNVQYPKMYSDDNDTFNCIQRAHQNTLENLPQFLFLLLAAGIGFPRPAAVAGCIWIAGRFAYGIGYCTGDPKKRMQGMFGYIGLLSLLGMAIYNGFQAL